jgi:hypothetical protein
MKIFINSFYIYFRSRIMELEKVRDNLIVQKEELLVSIFITLGAFGPWFLNGQGC